MNDPAEDFSRRSPGDGSTPRILLIEDNELNSDMLSRRLARHGFSVEAAFDGAEGLRKAREMFPSLILLDMSLPEIDGWEVARCLKADGALRGIPVIALTAHAMSGDGEQVLAAGCDYYDTKPINFPRLLSRIRSLLNVPGGADRQ